MDLTSEPSAMPGIGMTMAPAPAATTARMSIRADAASLHLRRDLANPWRAIDLDLSEVIGPRGTAAVLRRALATARRTHGWLPGPSDDCSFDACLQCLDEALGDRCTEEVGAGTLAVQMAFRGLLASLVGAALAEQLLGAAWTDGQAQGEPMP